MLPLALNKSKLFQKVCTSLSAFRIHKVIVVGKKKIYKKNKYEGEKDYQNFKVLEVIKKSFANNQYMFTKQDYDLLKV